MIEKKFRAWSVKTKAYCKQAYQGQVFHWIDSGQDFIVEQFTGLTDKNGVDIHDGDILKTDTGNYQVTIDPFISLGDYENGNYYLGSIPECHSWSDFEVIGNINHNPELLK